jgi:N-acyl-D-amino-acid deacylase
MQQKESGKAWQILAGRAPLSHREVPSPERIVIDRRKRPIQGKRTMVGKGTMVQFSRMRSFFVLLFFGLGAAFLLACADRPTSGPFDLIIRGGEVYDGSGAPGSVADVGIRAGQIVAVGDLAGEEAGEVLDVGGLHVAPGFIDAHSHAGPGLASEGLSHGEPLLAQGITTVFVNPDGGGPVDIAAQRADLSEYGLGVNAAQLISHGSVRREVIGMADRAPTPDELQRMRAMVRTAMEEGAWGLSSGTFYTPGSYSENSELIDLAREIAPFGGTYTSHVRDESDYTIGVLASVDEVIDVGRQAGVTSVHTHIKALGPNVWGKSAEIVEHIEAARAEGVRVYADQYPYIASATGLTAALLPRWAQAGGGDSLQARLRDSSTRAQIRDAMVENLARRGGADRIQFRRFEADESIEGRLLSDLAAERNQDPIDTALDLFRIGGPSIVSFNMNEDDVRVLMSQSWTMTASDGGLVPWMEGVPHPRSYGTFPRRIGHYTRDEGVTDLPQAIRSMTGLVAEVFGLHDRGRIAPGQVADIVVFDYERMNDPATFTEPHQIAEGVVYVLVNGTVAIEGGEFTGERAGRVLQKSPAGDGSS